MLGRAGVVAIRETRYSTSMSSARDFLSRLSKTAILRGLLLRPARR